MGSHKALHGAFCKVAHLLVWGGLAVNLDAGYHPVFQGSLLAPYSRLQSDSGGSPDFKTGQASAGSSSAWPGQV